MLGSNLFGSPKYHSIDYIIPVIRHGNINFHKIPNICNWYKKLKDSNSYSPYPLLFLISEQKYSVRYNLGEQYVMWVNLANAQFERSCSSPFGYKSVFPHPSYLSIKKNVFNVPSKGHDSFNCLRSFWQPITFFPKKMTYCEWSSSAPIKYWILNSERTSFNKSNTIWYLEKLFSSILVLFPFRCFYCISSLRLLGYCLKMFLYTSVQS